jgi:hypothetical protein
MPKQSNKKNSTLIFLCFSLQNVNRTLEVIKQDIIHQPLQTQISLQLKIFYSLNFSAAFLPNCTTRKSTNLSDENDPYRKPKKIQITGAIFAWGHDQEQATNLFRESRKRSITLGLGSVGWEGSAGGRCFKNALTAPFIPSSDFIASDSSTALSFTWEHILRVKRVLKKQKRVLKKGVRRKIKRARSHIFYFFGQCWKLEPYSSSMMIKPTFEGLSFTYYQHSRVLTTTF